MTDENERNDEAETRNEEQEAAGAGGEVVEDIGPQDIKWIMSYLPHRYPFLLVDRVLSLVPGKRVTAIKNFTINEEFFVGHFPGQPVVPGVLLIEAMAQAGGLLALYEHPDRHDKLVLFTGIDRARFRRPVVPGDQVRFEVEVQRMRSTVARLSGRAMVGDKLAAEAVLSSAMVDR